MMTVWERYTNDAVFRSIVDQLQYLLEQGNVTPTEVREAAMLAQLKYEDKNRRPTTFTREDVVKGNV